MGKKSRLKKERQKRQAAGITRNLAVNPGPTQLSAPKTSAPAPNKPVAISDASYTRDVLQSPIPVLVDYWASWCGPCRMIAPSLDKLAPRWEGKVKIAKYNTESNGVEQAKLGIRSIPTLVLYRDGQIVGTKVGALPYAALKSWVEQTLGLG